MLQKTFSKAKQIGLKIVKSYHARNKLKCHLVLFSLVNLVKVNEFHLLWPTSNDVDRLQYLLWDWQWLTQRNVKYQFWTLLSSLNRNLLGFGKRCASYFPSLHNKEKSRISTIISKLTYQMVGKNPIKFWITQTAEASYPWKISCCRYAKIVS